MSDAPRTIWLQYSFDMLDKHDDQPFPGGTRYHHDDVVRELVDAADALVKRWDSPAWGGSAENLRHTGEYIAELRAALTKIAQEGKP